MLMLLIPEIAVFELKPLGLVWKLCKDNQLE